MWPVKIEDAYQSWIKSRELFHPLDFKYFAYFLWACIDDPAGAPDVAQFRERLAKDRKLEPDEQGYPHSQVAKAAMLFEDFPDILRHKPKQ